MAVSVDCNAKRTYKTHMTEERRPLLPSMASPPQILPANAGASSVLKLERQFPMYVLPLDEVELLERFVPHEDIIDKLVEWKPGMGDVLFVSHTWLGNSHPDPHGRNLHELWLKRCVRFPSTRRAGSAAARPRQSVVRKMRAG